MIFFPLTASLIILIAEFFVVKYGMAYALRRDGQTLSLISQQTSLYFATGAFVWAELWVKGQEQEVMIAIWPVYALIMVNLAAFFVASGYRAFAWVTR